jgi:HlyD family secretion protein
MDQPSPKRGRNYTALGGVGVVALLAVSAVVWFIPRGLHVNQGDLRIATVEQGMYRNDVLVRSTAAPLRTVMLDALESGRVEEVLATDGALVKKGELLFRLSNPQMRLDLVAREADRAQQISNLSLLRVSIESSQTDHQRRMRDLTFAFEQAQKQHARRLQLVKQGFVPASTLEESEDQLAQHQRTLEDERSRVEVEMRIKRDGVRQMEQAIERLDAGLKVVNESIDGLSVRAPIAGRLTDFRLQIGEIVKPDQRIGRIDDPSQFKMTAEIDEYFLGGVSVGKPGFVNANGRDYAVRVSSVFPQIREGRFSIELQFVAAAPPGMSPGQSAETRITLGNTTPGLILPNDAFVNDSGGAWVFAVSPDGKTATRRAIRIGRRSNSQVEVASGLSPGERVIVSSYAAFGKAERLQIGT